MNSFTDEVLIARNFIRNAEPNTKKISAGPVSLIQRQNLRCVILLQCTAQAEIVSPAPERSPRKGPGCL
jgi:hypothetical protein